MRTSIAQRTRTKWATVLLLVCITSARIEAAVLSDDDSGKTVNPDQHFRRPRDVRPATEVRDIFYSVSMDNIPGKTPEQRAASLQAVFRAFENWDAATSRLNFVNVTPGHVDTGETAITAARNPQNAGAGATIDVLWQNTGGPGLTTGIRYAAPTTDAAHDEYTHIDILLRRNLGIINPDARGVRRLDNPLTNPFSVFTTQSLIDIETIALHEIGHTIGLDHPDEEVALNPTGLFSPFVRDPAAAAANPVRFINEDNYFRAHAGDGLPEPPYNIHNQHRSTSSAVMNSAVASGQISRTLTPDELGAIGIIYDDADARVAAVSAATAASLSFGPRANLAAGILIERDIHLSYGDPAPALVNNDTMARQTLPPGTRLVGNLYLDQTKDSADQYFFEVPAIPAGQQSLRMTFDIDAGREDPTGLDLSAKTGDLILRALTLNGNTTVAANRDATAIDEGSLYIEDPFLIYDFTEADITRNGNNRRFIVEVERQRRNLVGARDVDYILQICTPPAGAAGLQADAASQCECPTCGLDFGDAPDRYKTLLSSDGPRYERGDLQGFGLLWDAEPDGQPARLANGDDASLLGGFPGAADDDDGVRFGDDYVDISLRIDREGPHDYLLRAWWDADRNRCFDHGTADMCNSSSEAFIDELLTLEPGLYTRRYSLPFNPLEFPSRFRLTWDPATRDVWPYGQFVSRADGISHGEVEDYFIPEPSGLQLAGIGSLTLGVFLVYARFRSLGRRMRARRAHVVRQAF